METEQNEWQMILSFRKLPFWNFWWCRLCLDRVGDVLTTCRQQQTDVAADIDQELKSIWQEEASWGSVDLLQEAEKHYGFPWNLFGIWWWRLGQLQFVNLMWIFSSVLVLSRLGDHPNISHGKDQRYNKVDAMIHEMEKGLQAMERSIGSIGPSAFVTIVDVRWSVLESCKGRKTCLWLFTNKKQGDEDMALGCIFRCSVSTL